MVLFPQMIFFSLQYNFTNLIQRECFKDQLYIYRICANVVNCIDYTCFLLEVYYLLLMLFSQDFGSYL